MILDMRERYLAMNSEFEIEKLRKAGIKNLDETNGGSFGYKSPMRRLYSPRKQGTQLVKLE